MTQDKKKTGAAANRRGFLKMVGIGAVGGGVAAVTAVAATDEAEAKTQADDGYRETTHVKTYYDLARF